MSDPFYILYNKLKGDEEDLNAICVSLMEETILKNFPINEEWNMVDHAIKTNNTGLMNIASQCLKADSFYDRSLILEYGEDEIEKLYKIYGGKWHRKNKQSPISFFRDDKDVMRHIMKNGKTCKRFIVDDICSMCEEIIENGKILKDDKVANIVPAIAEIDLIWENIME